MAIIIPSVVPATTIHRSLKRAASATVAICVLSPISARKNATIVVPSTPSRNLPPVSSSSILSGISVHTAIAMKPRPSTQRKVCADTCVVIQLPTAPAQA